MLVWMTQRLVVNTTVEAGRVGGAIWEGSVWLYLVGLPMVFSINARTSWLKCFSYEDGTMAGSNIHLDSLMLAW